MNVIRLWEGYRNVGVNYGLPVHYVDIGPGMKLEPLEVIKRLRDSDLDVDRWVVFSSGFASEKGAVTLIEGLRAVRVHMEAEDDGSNPTPTWFPAIDRWVLYWTGKLTFNFGALRPNRDFIIYQGASEEVKQALEDSSTFQAVRGWLVDEPEQVYKEAKKFGIRVYRRR